MPRFQRAAGTVSYALKVSLWRLDPILWQSAMSFDQGYTQSPVLDEPVVERRTEERRIALFVPVFIVPVDDLLAPIGEAFIVRTRDVSDTGLGLIFNSPPDHALYAVEFEFHGIEYRMLMKAKWHRKLDDSIYVGFRGLRKLSQFPVAVT